MDALVHLHFKEARLILRIVASEPDESGSSISPLSDRVQVLLLNQLDVLIISSRTDVALALE